MAKVWVSVIVLFLFQDVFAEFINTESIFNCDECLRNGGRWCNSPAIPRCNSHQIEKWCSDEEEIPRKEKDKTTKGMFLSLTYSEKTVTVDKPSKKVVIGYKYESSVEPKISAAILNSTQSDDVSIDIQTTCENAACTTIIYATPRRNFCSSNGTSFEFFYVRIKVDNMPEEAYIKYNVPCACSCSQHAEKKSPKCKGKGEFSCGICTCESGWTGRYCDVPDCKGQMPRRGDTPCSKSNNVECFGNGYCNQCDTCVCYTDREGSQYFDQSNDCTDLCMITSECSSCLDNSTLGKCSDCPHPITIQRYNESISSQRDNYNRSVWVTCNATGDYCEYVTMQTESADIYVMVKPCNVIAAGQTSTTKVPMILGVLGILAAVAAIGGVMLWKHLNAVPPMPLTDPHYQNIDAQECTGENPLYKSPTSTYKNPLYNKW